jgi:hypothetical protein
MQAALAHPAALAAPVSALGAIAAVGVLGVLHELDRSRFGRFALDAERRLPAKFSAVLLIAAGALGVLTSLVLKPRSAGVAFFLALRARSGAWAGSLGRGYPSASAQRAK